jgi:hypothetical protein
VYWAAADVPSPSQTPNAYGGTGKSASGSSSGAEFVTEWLSRASLVAHRTERAISSVVRTSAKVR